MKENGSQRGFMKTDGRWKTASLGRGTDRRSEKQKVRSLEFSIQKFWGLIKTCGGEKADML